MPFFHYKHHMGDTASQIIDTLLFFQQLVQVDIEEKYMARHAIIGPWEENLPVIGGFPS